MNVGELIEELHKHDPILPVLMPRLPLAYVKWKTSVGLGTPWWQTGVL